ncbi:MAG: hypothetical protein AAGN46_11145 [Acidobacteriota bacterium]
MTSSVLPRCALTLWLVVGLCFLGVQSFADQAAGDASTPTQEEIFGHLRLDHDALAAMSREERREAMRAYKAAREQAALAAGLELETEGSFRRLDTPRRTATPTGLRAIGNITYDTGTVFGTAGLNSQMLGNRFDSALNTAGTACCFPVPTSGNITMITFDMVNTFFGTAIFSLYTNISGTMANQVTSMARTGVVTGLNTLSVNSATTANAYMNGTFLAGIWQFNTTMTALGVDTGTNAGQGFHAISLNDMAIGSMLTDVTTGGGGGLNAVFRVTGDVLTPVELMNFTID